MPAPLSLQAAWSQITGTRDEQQDAAAVLQWPNGYALLIVADGIGGHVGGRLASTALVAAMRQAFIEQEAGAADRDTANKDLLLTALHKANAAIAERVDANPALAGMGSTVVAATFDGTHLDWVGVGDSSLYLYRDAKLRRLNTLHSLGERLDREAWRGEISFSEARESTRRNELLAAVDGNDISLVDRPQPALALRAGDRVVLSSDGLDVLAEPMIERILDPAISPTAQDGVNDLLTAVVALDRPSQDNTTLIVAEARPVDRVA